MPTLILKSKMVLIGSETATSVQTDSGFYMVDMAIMGPEEITQVQRTEEFLAFIENDHTEGRPN